MFKKGQIVIYRKNGKLIIDKIFKNYLDVEKDAYFKDYSLLKNDSGAWIHNSNLISAKEIREIKKKLNRKGK